MYFSFVEIVTKATFFCKIFSLFCKLDHFVTMETSAHNHETV